MHRLSLVAVLLLTTAAACSSPHWSVPLPSLDRVPLSIAQLTPTDVFAVGGALGSGPDALMLHYDGTTWTPLTTNTDATLWWVHTVSPRSVWTVGERGTILHWNGTPTLDTSADPQLTKATLYGVWGPSDDDLWVVGGDPDRSGVILRRDAAGWRDITPAGTTSAFFKVWGASTNDVYICGQQGTLLHWDGTSLQPIATGLGRSTPLLTVAGRSAFDIYAVGGLGNAVVLHFDGAAWQQLTGTPFGETPSLAGVAVDSDGTAMLVGGGGTKLRGSAAAGWTDETAQATRVDLHAVSFANGNIYVVGGNYQAPAPAARTGVIAHFGRTE
jgi:photosystem II stability/assembly factor-like uncharacterized protein